jgi:hypothetical protein
MATQGYAQPDLSIRLFGYETGQSDLWKNPQTFSPSHHRDAYLQWRHTKRSFTAEEVIQCAWVCIINVRNGTSAFIFHFSQTSREVLAELLFDQTKQFPGRCDFMRMDAGIILRIMAQNQMQFVVFANLQRPVHSGLAYAAGQAAPYYYYFKFIPIQGMR